MENHIQGGANTVLPGDRTDIYAHNPTPAQFSNVRSAPVALAVSTATIEATEISPMATLVNLEFFCHHWIY